MSEKDPQSLDILGIKPVGEAVNTLVKGSVDGAAAFLSRICLPASEEFGLLLKDKVSHWRASNLLKIAEKTEKKLLASSETNRKHAHPRIASLALEHGSWIENDDVQEMWAGLLASSCTEDGKDDSNLIFMNLLSQLTAVEAKILNYACERAEKCISPLMQLVYAEKLLVSLEDLITLTGTSDVIRLDRELDHLTALDLLRDSGFPLIRRTKPQGVTLNKGNVSEIEVGNIEVMATILMPDYTSHAVITPSSLAISLYVRSQGSLKSPHEFFGLSE